MIRLILHDGLIIDKKFNSQLYKDWDEVMPCFIIYYIEQRSGGLSVLTRDATKCECTIVDDSNWEQYIEYLI